MHESGEGKGGQHLTSLGQGRAAFEVSDAMEGNTDNFLSIPTQLQKFGSVYFACNLCVICV